MGDARVGKSKMNPQHLRCGARKKGTAHKQRMGCVRRTWEPTWKTINGQSCNNLCNMYWVITQSTKWIYKSMLIYINDKIKRGEDTTLPVRIQMINPFECELDWITASKNQTSKGDKSHITEEVRQTSPSPSGQGSQSTKSCWHHAPCGTVWWDRHCSSWYFPQITRKHQTAKIWDQPTKYLISPPKCQEKQKLSCSRPEGTNETRQL